MKQRKFKNKGQPFLMLFNWMLDAPATRALSHGALRLYITLRREFNPGISERWNGRIYLSLRDAQEKMGSNREEIAKWYRELQYYGFIVMMTPGCLGVEGKGKAPHWRLTELDCKCTGVMEPATKDFLRWNGVIFQDQKKQNPGCQMAATSGRKRQPLVVGKGSHLEPEVVGNGSHKERPKWSEKAAILSLPYTAPVSGDPNEPGVAQLRHQIGVEEDDDTSGAKTIEAKRSNQ